jgi:hypothetical protein
MQAQKPAQSLEIDCPLFEKLGHPNEVLGPADAERNRDEVLWAQNARLDRPLSILELDFDIIRVRKGLSIERACDGQKLHWPAFDHHSFVTKFFVSPGLQVRKNWCETCRALIRGAIEGNQNIKIVGDRRFNIVVRRNSAADGIPAYDTVRFQSINDGKRLFHSHCRGILASYPLKSSRYRNQSFGKSSPMPR